MATDHPTRGPRPADGPVVGQTGARFGGTAGRRRRAAANLPEDDSSDVAPQHRDGETPVGQTGARFPSVLDRWRQKQDHDQEVEQQDSEQRGHEPAAREPQAQQAVSRPATAPPVSESSSVRGPEQANGTERASEEEWTAAGRDAAKETSGLVRPYYWTGGRTASRIELSVETLVSATGRAADPAASPEHRTILELCATPHSVAELAALLSMPLGVARVMLGDMAEAGSGVVHRTVGSADAAPDIELMRRVLAGLQRL